VPFSGAGKDRIITLFGPPGSPRANFCIFIKLNSAEFREHHKQVGMNSLHNKSREGRFIFGLLLVLFFGFLLFAAEPALAQETTERAAREPKALLFKPDFYKRLIINTFSVFIMVMLVYLPIHRKKDYFFTFLILNFLIFIITYLISYTTAFTGFAGIGLLAFFSLLRLRTDTISMKDMTYLFLVVTLGLVNAILIGPTYELITLDLVIIALTYFLDKDWLTKSIHVREMKLNSLNYVMPEETDKLLHDLRSKTGLDIQRVKILSVDLVKNRAEVQIFYY